MNIDDLKYCPGTLAEGFNTYSPICLRAVFNGKKVHHILPYAYQKDDAESEQFLENRKRISISGVQEKLSMLLDKNNLRLTSVGEQGTYILKPIPRDLKNVGQVPANEHLTMQIAKQVFNINTAENAMIFFNNGIPAYITKRFDVKDDNTKWGKEDFASLAGKTKDNAGPDFKYKYSYQEVGKLIQELIPAWRVEIEKYFALVLFNYVFSNGDAHLKNFSVLCRLMQYAMLKPKRIGVPILHLWCRSPFLLSCFLYQALYGTLLFIIAMFIVSLCNFVCSNKNKSAMQSHKQKITPIKMV
jgi:serine/threonine-protein kinase HipA